MGDSLSGQNSVFRILATPMHQVLLLETSCALLIENDKRFMHSL